jgi:hypothetical protein
VTRGRGGAGLCGWRRGSRDAARVEGCGARCRGPAMCPFHELLNRLSNSHFNVVMAFNGGKR